MLEALASYERALAGRDHLICYAMKANSNLAVLQTFRLAGWASTSFPPENSNVSSPPGETRRKTVFSGVGKTREEMQRGLQAGVMCFNVESEAELSILSDVASQMVRQRVSACG